MAAKTAASFVAMNPVGFGSFTDHGTTKSYDLGQRVKVKDSGATAYGLGEVIYLKGLDATVRGTAVLIKDDFSTSILTARDIGAVAVALAATVTGEYGWYQILGQGVVSCDTVAAAAPCYIDGTPGRVDDAAVAGDAIVGMRTVTSDDTATCVVNMTTYPSVGDADNA